MKRIVSREPKASALAFAILAVTSTVASAQQPAAMPALAQTSLVLENQFGQSADLAAYRGTVVVLVFADRKGTDASRALGEHLHICWHPDAKGQPPATAQKAPVIGLQGLPAGQMPPEVCVIPVACCGKVPGPVRAAIRTQMAQAVPDVPIWLDFGDAMKTQFGLSAGEPNVVVFDAAGRLRLKIIGAPDQPALDKLMKTVESLRQEAAAGK